MITPQKMLTFDEGRRARAYRDTVGNITVGVGFNMDNIYSHKVWHQASIVEDFQVIYTGKEELSTSSIDNLLDVCIYNTTYDLIDVFGPLDNITEGPTLAMVNMMFNMGKPVFKQFNTTIELIKAGLYNDTATHIMNTRWAKQLPLRAKRVAALFKGDDSLYTGVHND